MNGQPTIDDIKQAAERIRPFVHRTPVLTSVSLNAILGLQLFFKCENFQKTGAYKFRGATNAVLSLSDEEVARGVATHSSGNHAAALSLAARERGITAYIVMPSNAPAVKKAAVAGYGGKIVFCEPTLQARESALFDVVGQTGATVVHPYNDNRVIAGAGTTALELLADVPDLDVVIAPVGGGGLMSGTALTVTALSPRTRVLGAEPEGADDAYRSMAEGHIVPSVQPKTIADGLLSSLGDLTFPILRASVDRIVTASDPAIVTAMRYVWERMKIIIEPSAAVTLAIVLERKIDLAEQRVGVILSGGNVDLDRLPWVQQEERTVVAPL
jgi:threonine dehydratase